MSPYAPATRKFISAVWRRIVLVRIAESIAVSSAIASAAGLALMPILWWRGQSGLPLSITLLALGATCGLIWGFSRRPSRFEAAVEADRQLGLHDLLGTIHLLSRENSPQITTSAWKQSIASLSDRQCQLLRPGAVVVNRLGLRGWSGVGVLGAMLITLGLFTAHPVDVSAASPAGSSEFNQPPNPSPLIAHGDEARQSNGRPPGPGGVDESLSRQFPHNRPDDSPGNSSAQTKSDQGRSTSAADSIGGGSALTNTSDPNHQAPGSINSNTDRLSHSGPVASGIGQSDSHASGLGNSDATIASPDAIGRRTPAWKSGQWQDDAAAAQAAIAAGQVPDSDVDLVRDYFKRD